MTLDRGAAPATSRAGGAGWWLRTSAMVLIPIGIALLAARHSPTGVVVVVGLLAFVGAIYVFHPDTLGWKLSLTGYMTKGSDTGPSHVWQVWARLSGLFLVLACAAGAFFAQPSPTERTSCTFAPDGSMTCSWDQPQDAPTGT